MIQQLLRQAQILAPARNPLTGALFLRLLGLIYLFAFASHALQVAALYGSDGIIPLVDYLPASNLQGWDRWTRLPTLFWISQADSFLLAIPIIAMAAALLLVANIATTASLVVLWVSYLSVVNAGPVFMQFQWDMLLLETGFLAIVFRALPSLGVFLFRWLLFRFMWLSGWVKIRSGDPMWADWSALTVHFETQPLPTSLGWYAHQLPGPLLQWATGAALFIELVLPFCIFLPRQPRLIAFWGIVLLQLLIFLTGNYNFFNLLTLCLCLFLLDDRRLQKYLPGQLSLPPSRPARRGRPGWVTGACVLILALTTSLTQLYLSIGGSPPSPWQRQLLRTVQPFHIANSYGVFAVMTPRRPELIIEGSNDSLVWHPYRFRYKPDALNRSPTWISPFQPRLDWQLWFAALRPVPPQWLENLLVQLLMGSEDVQALFARVPFGNVPPAYIRIVRYNYEFTDFAERSASGDWWKSEFSDNYQTPMRLSVKIEQDLSEPREIPW